MSLDDIKAFRQLDSKCPGHPEHGITVGVETTTGPLGQGCGNSVGMAMASKWLAAKFNKPICVAELGYVGDAGYVRNWAEEALKPDTRFPKLACVVYFNDKEVAPWPGHYGLPNWRVDAAMAMRSG